MDRLNGLFGPYLPVPFKVFLPYRPSVRFVRSEFGEVFKSLSLRCWARGGLGLGFLTWWKDCVGFLLKEG